jgi:hypothetical protein
MILFLFIYLTIILFVPNPLRLFIKTRMAWLAESCIGFQFVKKEDRNTEADSHSQLWHDTLGKKRKKLYFSFIG